MTLNVSVKGGTRAGIRRPFAKGHGPKCVCSKCETTKEGK